MDFKDLTDDQMAKARACGSAEELMALAQEEGIELSEEQLEAVSGGWGGSTPGCGAPYYECPSYEGNPR